MYFKWKCFTLGHNTSPFSQPHEKWAFICTFNISKILKYCFQPIVWSKRKKKQQQLPVFLNGNTSILTHKLRWLTMPNEDRSYLRCLNLKISKMWLPLQYIALSAHKSSDAIVINLLNKVHREEKEWRRIEKYGGKSRRMDVTFWRMKRRLNPKKNTSVRKGFNGGNGSWKWIKLCNLEKT